MNYIEFGYLGLFIACFLAATILPFTSEGIFVVFLLQDYSAVNCLVIATLGNTLGGVTNYLIGMLGKERHLQRLFANQQRFLRFKSWVSRYGGWTALLAWLPFIGDPLCVFLGFVRTPFLLTLFFMSVGKFLRYALILYFTI